MVHSCADCKVEVTLGSRIIAHRFYVMDTQAFDFVLGTNFFVEHSRILSLSLPAPYVLQVDHGDSWESVPLEQSEHTSSYLTVCKREPSTMMVASKTEDYQLLGDVLDQGLRELGYSREELNVELFASDKQHVLDLYCSRGKNCCYEFYWPSFGMAYGVQDSVTTTWRWGPQEQQAFDELKDKVANAKCLGVPRAQGEIILVTDASNVGRAGTLFQWQALAKEEFYSAISQWGTDGLNRDGTLKHSYPDDKWVLIPLGHWNWKWNQARGNYSTYEQELLAGMLVLSSQSRLLGSNPVVWLCDKEPVRTFQKGPPPEKAKLRRC